MFTGPLPDTPTMLLPGAITSFNPVLNLFINPGAILFFNSVLYLYIILQPGAIHLYSLYIHRYYDLGIYRTIRSSRC